MVLLYRKCEKKSRISERVSCKFNSNVQMIHVTFNGLNYIYCKNISHDFSFSN